MVRLLYCHAGIFLCSKNPDLEDLGEGPFKEDFEREVIQSLKTSGYFIKSFYSKFGLNKKPTPPKVTFASDYFANPYHWLITIPSPYHQTNEPVSSVVHETAHCLHWKANPQIWEERNMSGRKRIEARFMTEVVAELSAHMYLENLGCLEHILRNFPPLGEGRPVSKVIVENYDFLKSHFEALASTQSTDYLKSDLRRTLFEVCLA
jgi:hypothetical protein